MKKSLALIALIVLILAGVLALYFTHGRKNNSQISSTTTPNSIQTQVASTITSPQVSPSVSSPESKYAEPVVNYKARVTKKPFGIYITKQNSPIQPERFSGYHTGADAEYTDVTTDVPVYAIADGAVVLSEYASGYGGVFMISFDLNGSTHTALYGHIRLSSLPRVGTKITKGQQLGLLGTGYSSETDGERRHLHFAILSDNSLNIKGYVQTKAELDGWIDPLTVL